jgi:hypothetical protein
MDRRDELTKEECRAGKSLIGYTEIKCHIIFDIKMDFTRKARFVAGGHLTEAPTSITYSTVVSRDSVRLAFLIAGLNNLDVMACDIGNAYLNAPCREKIWFLGGGEAGRLDFNGWNDTRSLSLSGLLQITNKWASRLRSTLLRRLNLLSRLLSRPTLLPPSAARQEGLRSCCPSLGRARTMCDITPARRSSLPHGSRKDGANRQAVHHYCLAAATAAATSINRCDGGVIVHAVVSTTARMWEQETTFPLV